MNKKKRSKRQRRKERYTHLNAEFQRIARRVKKAFLSDQCKEVEENKRMGKTAAAAAKSLQSCPTLCDPIDGSPPGFPSLGFSRQEHWSRLPFPSPMHESEK